MPRAVPFVAFALLACQPKSSTPPETTTQPTTETPEPANDDLSGIEEPPASEDPTSEECVAKCLESDKYKDQTMDDREATCRKDCPEPQFAPGS